MFNQELCLDRRRALVEHLKASFQSQQVSAPSGSRRGLVAASGSGSGATTGNPVSDAVLSTVSSTVNAMCSACPTTFTDTDRMATTCRSVSLLLCREHGTVILSFGMVVQKLTPTLSAFCFAYDALYGAGASRIAFPACGDSTGCNPIGAVSFACKEFVSKACTCQPKPGPYSRLYRGFA